MEMDMPIDEESPLRALNSRRHERGRASPFQSHAWPMKIRRQPSGSLGEAVKDEVN